jgi:hypothetical protein
MMNATIMVVPSTNQMRTIALIIQSDACESVNGGGNLHFTMKERRS